MALVDDELGQWARGEGEFGKGVLVEKIEKMHGRRLLFVICVLCKNCNCRIIVRI